MTAAPTPTFAPWWWERVPRPVLPAAPIPRECDVAIVGSGYTGLHAALVTARAGRHTLVFDAEDAGFGCSTRNGGQISTSVKPSFAALAKRHGEKRAFEIMKEGQRSLAFVGDFVRNEAIDCDFGVVGRFHAAHNPAQYEALAKSVSAQPRGLEVPAHIVPRAEQRSEIDTDAYHGGVVYEAHASIDPARYHQGLLERVTAAQAQITARSPVIAIERDGDRFRVRSERGSTLAREVVVATNGYSGALLPWLRRRLIPIGSYMIATEELPATLTSTLIPRNRIVSDTRKVVFYYRLSPDRRRILFGGRVSVRETDPAVSGPLLRADLVKIFPALAEVRISHSWCGFVAYTFDELAHLGIHEGIRYAAGYCGSGVGMASYLGMRLGQQALGLPDGRTAFDGLPFATRPLYSGNPWFLAPAVRYYRLRDRLPI